MLGSPGFRGTPETGTSVDTTYWTELIRGILGSPVFRGTLGTLAIQGTGPSVDTSCWT